MRHNPEEADYVVVGAGSAGCVLANRLTAAGATVILLEAGKWDRDPLIHVPLGVGKIFPERRHDWNYFMEPEAALAARGIECARGKVVGGSSSINVMAYVRGHRRDYDRWAAAGLTGWGYADVLPYFRRSETWEGGGDDYRGGDGPLHVQRTRYHDPIIGSFIEAGTEAGFPQAADYNGAEQAGFAPIQQTIHRGRRWSAATAYLRPALRRPNLHVVVGAQVERVTMQADRATGVAFREGSRSRSVRARREVILCGGVIDTPKLLMLSGIGDPVHLAQHGIATLVASREVGRNLQDHLSVLVTHRRSDRSVFQDAMRYDRLSLAMLRSLLGAGGFAGDVPIGATAFLSTQDGLPAPDVQFLFLAAPFPARPYLPPFRSPVPDGYGCRVALLRPRSRGTVTLRSADASAAPRITGNFLSDPADLDTLVDGVGLLRRVLAQPAMSRHDGGEIAPGADATTREQVEAFIRRSRRDGAPPRIHLPHGWAR